MKNRMVKIKMRVSLEERNGEVGKECTHCMEWKPLTNFTPKGGRSLGGVDSKCKTCRNAIKRKAYARKNNGEVRMLRTYSDKELIELTKRIYEGEITPKSQEYKRVTTAICKKYGSLGEAYVTIGLNYSKRSKWDEDTIKDMFIELLRKNECINGASISRNYSGFYGACLRLYGSWDNALKKQKIDPISVKLRENGKWDKNTLINEILAERDKGTDLSHSSIRLNRNDILQASQKLFGSWRDALNIAGICYDDYLYNNVTTSICGSMFEKVAEQLCNDLRIEGIHQKRVIKGDIVLIPDLVTDKDSFYDFKLSEWSVNGCNTINKYEPHCRMLTIIFMRGNPNKDEMITNKTRLLSVHKLIKQLPKEKRKLYISKIQEIEKDLLIIEKNQITA